MTYKKNEFKNSTQVIGPIDCMLRALIGLLILLSSFALQLNILEMTELFGITIYLWLTGLTRWDPFYYVFYKVWDYFKIRAHINGHF